jgi:hypothetical protein
MTRFGEAPSPQSEAFGITHGFETPQLDAPKRNSGDRLASYVVTRVYNAHRIRRFRLRRNRSDCSAGVTRLPRSYGPLRHLGVPIATEKKQRSSRGPLLSRPAEHLGRPDLALAGCRLRVTRPHRRGFSCCVGSPCAGMPPPIPRWHPGACRIVRGYPLPSPGRRPSP